MLIERPPKIAVASFMGDLKGKSSLILYEKFPALKYKYRNREFWCCGYYVDTAGKNAKKIQEYIQRQYEQNKAGEPLPLPNFQGASLRAASNKTFAAGRPYLREVTRTLVF